MSDRIVLTIPSDARFRSVATLVLGGVGTRADLPYERMDDLQLAVLSVLEAADGGSVTLEVDAGEDGLRLAIGPLEPGSAAVGGLNLVLSRLVDDVAHERREAAAWVVLTVGRHAAP